MKRKWEDHISAAQRELSVKTVRSDSLCVGYIPWLLQRLRWFDVVMNGERNIMLSLMKQKYGLYIWSNHKRTLWDQHVRRNFSIKFRIELDWLEQASEIYYDIEKWYEDYVNKEEAKNNMRVFDEWLQIAYVLIIRKKSIAYCGA